MLIALRCLGRIETSRALEQLETVDRPPCALLESVAHSH